MGLVFSPGAAGHFCHLDEELNPCLGFTRVFQPQWVGSVPEADGALSSAHVLPLAST